MDETGADSQNRLWLRGAFPRSHLAPPEASSLRWRESFVLTLLERDMPQLGIHVAAETPRRFWLMLCHYHGQTWNGSAIARSIGVSLPTARRYLDLLAGVYLVRVLPPWLENLKKRQVRSPKVYVHDSGLLHHLHGREDMLARRAHLACGASWEGFALEQVLAVLGEQRPFFWGTQRGAELDLLLFRHGRRGGVRIQVRRRPPHDPRHSRRPP